MRPARQASSASTAAPAAKTRWAGRLRGLGSTGISAESSVAIVPAAASAATSATWRRSSRPTLTPRRSAGSAEAARISPPAGRLSAPASWTRPFIPTSQPGVANACTSRPVAITEKAMPSSTARASRRRAALTESAIAATAVSTPPAPAKAACSHEAGITW